MFLLNCHPAADTVVPPVAAAVLVAAAVERGRVAPLAADVQGQGAQALLVLPAVVVPLALGARPDATLEVVVRRLEALLARVAILVGLAHGGGVVAHSALPPRVDAPLLLRAVLGGHT